eukprot:scaffold467285_cov17-Prasinocladus_malaysianus.AAC.1
MLALNYSARSPFRCCGRIQCRRMSNRIASKRGKPTWTMMLSAVPSIYLGAYSIIASGEEEHA